MLKKIYTDIENGVDVRQNLSKLRQIIKDFNENLKLRKIIGNNYEVLLKLLSSEDAKTRKNAALLLGDIAAKDCLPAIFSAYLNEKQLFVRSAYLSAMELFNCEEYLPQLKKRVEEIKQSEWTEENTKHFNEEIRHLNKLIVEAEGIDCHEFSGYNRKTNVILLTNALNADVTVNQLKEIYAGKEEIVNSIKKIGAGVHFVCDDIKKALMIRTFSEMLFLVPKAVTCPKDGVKAAKILFEAGVYDFISKRHIGSDVFYYRTEVKGKLSAAEKGKFIKQFSGTIDHLSDGRMINSSSDYEIEIRFIESKNDCFNIMIKCMAIPDDRFVYRKEVVPASIKPVDAALIMELSRGYFKENAKVLDPFCGVGTMLIERHKKLECNTMYGVDINGDAISKARINSEIAGQIIHYINRDFFTFQHEYLFDEIVTNMPFAIGKTTENDIRTIYEKFFMSINKFLVKGGRIFMYSRNSELVRRCLKKYNYKVVNSVQFLKNEDGVLWILQGL